MCMKGVYMCIKDVYVYVCVLCVHIFLKTQQVCEKNALKVGNFCIS